MRVAYIWEKPLEACLHKAFDKYKLKALKKPLMLNHFLTYNFGKVKKWYKGSQIAPNTLNIKVLYIFKGSRRLHINCRLLCVTC